MNTNNNIGKHLWWLSVVFISYLLIGSFIISRDIVELIYLLTLYAFLIVDKILEVRKKSHSKEE